MQAFCSSAPVAKDWRSCFWRCFSARFSGLRQQVNVYQCWSKQPWPWWCQGLRLQKLNRNTSQSPSGSTQVRRGRLGRCWHGCRGATEGKETNTLYCIAKFMTLIVFLWLSPCGFWPRIATPNSMRTFRSLSFFAHISTGWIAILGQRSHSTKDSYRTTLFPRFLLWNNHRRLWGYQGLSGAIVSMRQWRWIVCNMFGFGFSSVLVCCFLQLYHMRTN